MIFFLQAAARVLQLDNLLSSQHTNQNDLSSSDVMEDQATSHNVRQDSVENLTKNNSSYMSPHKKIDNLLSSILYLNIAHY